jgi:hypothetical protein
MVPSERLESILSTLPGLDGNWFDPRVMIEAVNTFQTLGKEEAIRFIRGWVQRTQLDTADLRQKEGILIFLRVLFDVPESLGGFPPLNYGAFIPKYPSNRRAFPRFPMAIAGGIPLLFVSGYYFWGWGYTSIEAHLSQYEQHGDLRSRPLVPTDCPLNLLTELESLSVWREYVQEPSFGDAPIVLANRLRYQLFRLVSHLVQSRPLLDEYENTNFCYDVSTLWVALQKEIPAYSVRWDLSAHRYERVGFPA